MDATVQINLAIGATLQNGKYEIVRVLGQGGFGITYLVKHTILNKTYALKEFFPQDYCNRDGSTSHISVATQSNNDLVGRLRTRFITEAQNIARLQHPNIIAIHDIFEENATAYFVMDFIEGESLDDLVRRVGPLPEQKALEYAKAVASAVDYIHQRKMTHFDIKPANVMVRESDGVPVLIDFGLSKQYNDSGHANSTMLIGLSHGYSPIEQYMQSGMDEFSPKIDIYALGATLYTLLSGRVPPEAPKLIDETIMLPVNISQPVTEAVRWAMAPTPERRCPSAAEFIQALEGAATPTDGRTVVAGPASGHYMNPAVNQAAQSQQSVQQPVQEVPQYDQYLSEEPKKKMSGAVKGALVGGGILVLGLLGFLIFGGGSSKKGSYAQQAAMIQEAGDTETSQAEAVGNSESSPELVAASATEDTPVTEEVVAVEASNPLYDDGYYEFSGNADGQYPVIYKLTFSTSGGQRYVRGKYAYRSSLRKYGDRPESWFTLSGTIEGNSIYWSESTKGNPDYDGYFRGSLGSNSITGYCGSNNPGAPEVAINVYL